MRIISLIALMFWTFFVQSQNKITIKKTPQHVDTFAVEGDSLVISLSGDSKAKKKVFLSTGSGGSITYVPSIDSLRNYPGNTTKLVIAKGYWNGLQYGGGPFTWYATDITGRGDDGGISIAAPSGYWVRVDRQFRATYYGMVDTSDLDVIEKYDNTWEADNLTNVIPDGEKLILDPGYVFRTRGGFNWGYDQFKTIHVEGYGSTLLRGSQIQDSVKSNSSTWVRVAHPERWDTFQYIALYDGTDRMSSPGRIWKINGDTLFAGIGVGNYATGDCYSQSYQMVFLKDGCTLRGLTFDGNLDSNTYYNYWGTSGAIYLSSNNAFVNRITIKNSPGEGILCFEENVVVDGFVIENCNGNGIHFGANNNVQVLNGIIKRVNNLARRSNIMTMGHEGGAIAHSDEVHGCMISNIQIDSALVAIADLNGHDDSLNHYDRIQAYNCIRAVEFQQLAGGQTLRDLRLTNSRFYNCGQFIITSNATGPADSTEYVRDVVIDNVQFYNTTLNLNASNYNITMSNIYYDDTSSTEINATYCYHLKINGLVKNGGGRIYMAATPGAVLENFEMRNVNASHFLHLADAGQMIVRNGAFYQDNAPSGFIGIYGPRTGEIRDCYMKLGGSPTYGILCSGGVSGGLGTTVVNCTFITPAGVAGIRSYGGSSGDLYINNKVTADISNASGNREYGTINVTDNDLTFGNLSVINILGKIKDTAGNAGTAGQVLTSDASGFATWQTPSTSSGDIEGVTVTSPITGGGTSGTVNIAIQQANGSQSGYLSSTDWTTFNNKWTPSGTTAYVPFFSSSSALTSQHDFITLNSSNAFKLGLGFTSGGNSQLDNHFTSTSASGLSIYDDAPSGTKIAGLGLSTSSIKWSIFNSSANNDLSFHSNGGSWVEKMRLTDAGELILPSSNSSDSKLLYINSSGTLVALPHGTTNQVLTQTGSSTFGWAPAASGGISTVVGINNIGVSTAGSSVTITDNQNTAGRIYQAGFQNYTATSPAPKLVDFSNSIVVLGCTTSTISTDEYINLTFAGTYKVTYTINAMATGINGNTNAPIHTVGMYLNNIEPGATGNTQSGFTRESSGSGQWVTMSRTEILTISSSSAKLSLKYNQGSTGDYDISLGLASLSVQRIQ